jgi:hypothetical protein
MSTEAITCHVLKCDIEVASDCDGNFIDRENEGLIHGSSPEEVREWATGRDYDYDWISLPDGRDSCPECRRSVAGSQHGFVPDPEVPSCCLFCEEWATEGDHGLEVVPGQLEIGGAA